MAKNWAAIGVLALAVSGCVSPEQREAAEDAHCRALGNQIMTEGYFNCRMAIDAAKARPAPQPVYVAPPVYVPPPVIYAPPMRQMPPAITTTNCRPLPGGGMTCMTY